MFKVSIPLTVRQGSSTIVIEGGTARVLTEDEENDPHAWLKRFELHTRKHFPEILHSLRVLRKVMIEDPPQRDAMQWLIRHARDGAVSKAILGLDEGRHVLSLCAKGLGVTFKETPAIRDVKSARDLLVAHTRVSRISKSRRADFEKTRRQADRIEDLLESAARDLLAEAQSLMRHPEFRSIPVRSVSTEVLQADEIGALIKVLKENRLY